MLVWPGFLATVEAFAIFADLRERGYRLLNLDTSWRTTAVNARVHGLTRSGDHTRSNHSGPAVTTGLRAEIARGEGGNDESTMIAALKWTFFL